MSRNKILLIAVATVLIGAAVYWTMDSDPAQDPSAQQQSGESPSEPSAPMTTQSVPAIVEQGVTPAPSDAFGTYKPPTDKKDSSQPAQ